MRIAEATATFDLNEERTTVEPSTLVEYRDAPVLATKVDGERALRATALRHRWLRLADAYLDGALGALVACELVSAGLHGRIMAMDRWCVRYDPEGQTDVDAFFEAAGRQPLISTNDGIGFEPVAFRELIEFIREMPY